MNRRIAFCVSTFLVVGSALAGDFDPWTDAARYDLEYRADFSQWAGKESGSVRVWLPTPADGGGQRVLARNINSPWKCHETSDANGNRFAYFEPHGKGGEVVMRFTVERRPYAGTSKSDVRPGTSSDPARYMKAQSRVPLDGKVRENAEVAGKGLNSDAEKIRAFYDYVTRSMRYGKDGEGWGRGDAIWACNAKYGNCTDFHSVIIGMCRGQGIPARFTIGYPIPADKLEARIKGYHCWAEAYDRDHGWVPMDASEAWKSSRFDDFFGKLPSDRVAFTVGRDLVLEPRQKGEPLNFFIYPYVEVDGKPAGEVPWTLDVRRIEDQ